MKFDILETNDDQLLATFYYRHWLDMDTNEQAIAADWRERALAFIADARRRKSFAGFCAVLDDEPVGSACCQIMERVYPAFHTSDASVVGYIWGVYVTPALRGQGVGAALVTKCTHYLKGQGCGRVLLHAGERARPLYDRLGFQPTDELALMIEATGGGL
jgi:GNAT superfamily N-acetyltransferase